MVAILSTLLTTGCSVVGIRTAPEPAYTVERTIGAVQIRRYGSRVAAETIVTGDEIRARSVGFERLAGYIFGGNSGRRSIEMTAPVGQSAIPEGSWRIRFFMPSAETPATLPRPDNGSVVVTTLPPERVAVLRFGGTPTKAAVRDADRRLLRTLAEAGIPVEGDPFDWFYDPPWTLPALRRNEAVIRVGST